LQIGSKHPMRACGEEEVPDQSERGSCFDVGAVLSIGAAVARMRESSVLG
jgi:hypothetical protein